MAVRRIVRARGESYQQADTVFLGIRRQNLVGEAGRGFLPVRFRPGLWRWQHRRLASLGCDSLREAAPQRVWRSHYIGGPGDESADNRTKRLHFLSALLTRGEMSLQDGDFAHRQSPQSV